jgi:hypothetical protein
MKCDFEYWLLSTVPEGDTGLPVGEPLAYHEATGRIRPAMS